MNLPSCWVHTGKMRETISLLRGSRVEHQLSMEAISWEFNLSYIGLMENIWSSFVGV